jgi:hypothetical protein
MIFNCCAVEKREEALKKAQEEINKLTSSKEAKVDRYVDGWMNKWMDEQMNGSMHGFVVGGWFIR